MFVGECGVDCGGVVYCGGYGDVVLSDCFDCGGEVGVGEDDCGDLYCFVWWVGVLGECEVDE